MYMSSFLLLSLMLLMLNLRKKDLEEGGRNVVGVEDLGIVAVTVSGG